MKMYPKAFPAGRRKRPKRRAEQRVYETLADNDRQGFVYYEWRRGYRHIELDFGVWIAGVDRFALQVKGGHFQLIGGEWHRKTRYGVQAVEKSPLDETWLAALDLHDEIAERAHTGYNPFVIPVLAFPDMEPDPDIMRLAERKGVYVVWGLASLVSDLADIARARGISHRLSWERIAREVCAISDGQIRLAEFAEDSESSADAEVGSGSTPASVAVLAFALNGKRALEVRGQALGLEIGQRASTRPDLPD